MRDMVNWLARRAAAVRARADRGAAAVEYGLLVALIAVAIIAAVSALGGHVACTFRNAGDQLATPATATGTC